MLLAVSVLITGCGFGIKGFQSSKKSTYVINFDAPSPTYVTGITAISRQLSAEDWLTIAKENYQEKKYARSLRAATEAFNRDDQLLAARELAMLSAIKVTQSNIDSYHDNTLMNATEKSEFKEILTRMTTLMNAAD